jgi:DNA-binding transcriptional LysR family regulator
MLDFRLRVFHSVAHNLSFTKASNELFITQPAITKHIRALEEEFGLKLFDRVGNKIILTKAGETLLAYTDQILNLHNEMRFEMSRLKGEPGGILRLGASTTIAQYVIPSGLAKFHERYPDMRLSLISGNTEFIEKRLLKGEIDIGIVEGKPSNSDIRYSSFLNDELVIFTSPENKKAGDTVTASDLVKLPLVLRERGSGTLEIIELILHQFHINPGDLDVIMFLGSTEAIKSYIRTGNGVGIVSKFALEQELASGIFRKIESPEIKFFRQFYFISPKGPEPSGITKLFINFLIKAIT